jgi:hypothetical protein
MFRQRRYDAAGLCLALATVLGVSTLGQSAPAIAEPSREELEGGESIAVGLARAAYYIEKAISEVTVDGVLDEPAWESARRFTLDYETWPSENTPALVETEAWVTYGESALYVGFHAYDPDPASIRARIADRDNAFGDDFLGIGIDTFNDERRAFEFFVNPLGVQMDMFLDGVSGDESESWDAIWHSAGKITEDGYVVEMEIPFNQLRFPAGKQEHVWGFDLVRFYPREDRHRLSIHPLDRDNDCYLCQASKMKGFGGISPGRNIEVVPTLTGRQAEERTDFPTGDLEGGDPQNELGLTARWGMTPNLTLSATVNPDFSQVEADAAQLAVNQRFALFFPERRPFFLEGADFFSTPLDAVFTRNVASPDWGLKLTGKQGKSAIGVFVAEDEITNLLLPGAEGSDSTTLDFGSTDAVVRYRRDLGESSTLGVLMTHRGGAGYANSVGGVDGLYRITDSDSLRFQWLRSSTEYPGEVLDEFEQPDGIFEDQAFSMSYRRSTREWNVYSSYEDIGRDFRADLGFVPQVDRKEFEVGGQRIWYGEDDDWYNRIRAGVEWQTQEDQSGQLLERETEINFSITGPYQLFAGIWPAQRTRVFEGRTFEQEVVNTYVEMSPSGNLYFSLFAGGGDAIDFEETRPAEVLFLEPRLRYNFGRRLKATLSHNLQQLDIDEGRLFEANLSQLRLVYQFNPRAFVRSVSQYTVVERNQDLFTEEVEARAETLFSQLLFAYKLNPQTVFFLGYSDSYEGDDTLGLTQRDRAIFTKFGYAWVM